MIRVAVMEKSGVVVPINTLVLVDGTGVVRTGPTGPKPTQALCSVRVLDAFQGVLEMNSGAGQRR